MHYEQLRQTMIDSQVRTFEVLDADVLQALREVPREQYVPAPFRHLAFADFEIPLPHGEKMWTPKMEARVLQELELRKTDRVLEIGTGSGYFTALLAHLGGMVHSVDDRADFVREAEERLAKHGIQNVQCHHADASQGFPDHGPYDVMVLTGSVPELSPAWFQQLSPGGRLLAIIGQDPVMVVRRYVRLHDGSLNHQDLFETVVPPLRYPHKAQFIF